ncbi:MAG TPA: hypothetical protein VE783_11655 [Candidatus Limnocylindrales bacterium]|jgi:hypothetical protein|nr:hypothetical protein [Candidatus Limnocylindrales bacterium]
MPVARILTRFPERTSALVGNLQHHGYTVEIMRPGEAVLRPADLEIDFEICNNEDALQRASELAQQWGTDVAVSPGLGELAPEPLADVVERPMAEAMRDEDEIVVIPPLTETAPATATMQQEEELAPQQPQAALEQPLNFEQPLNMEESVPERGAANFEQENAHEALQPGDMNARREAEPVEISRDPRDLRLPPEEIAEPAEPRPDYAQKAGEFAAATLNSAKALGARSGEWLHQNSELLRQRLDLKLAEMRARREIRQEQQAKRKALAQERAAELEAARQAAALRLQELLRERGGLTDTQPTPPRVEPGDAQPERRTAVAGAASFFRKHLGFSFHSGISPQLEAVLMGVAAACALFVLGLAVASFHATPAISSTVNAQQPYKGATVQAGGVTLKPAAAATAASAAATNAAPASNAPSATTHASAERPSPVVRSSTAKPPSQQQGNVRRIGSDVLIRRLDQPKTHTGGGDVTIRQLGAGKPATAQSTPGPRRISDLDQ